ncbi:MAG: amino acid adenylation domain-containing protein [Mycobacteriales bacterium]
MQTLLRELSEIGVELRPEGDRLRFRGPAGALSADLRRRIVAHRSELLAALRAGAAEDGHPAGFELTDLQRAYWLGARGLYPLSTVAHVRHEYQVALLDLDALHSALSRLVSRHDVLRTVVRADGSQVVLAEVAVPRPRCVDLGGLRGPELDRALDRQRATALDDLPDDGSGPPFAVRAIRVPDGHRVVLVVRLAALDGPSLRRFLGELTELYLRPDRELPAVPGRYRDLVESATHPPARRSAAALRHWEERARTLPGNASLPLRDRDRLPERSSFVRRHTRLPAADTAVLRERSGRHGVTVSAALGTAYVATLRRWSSTKDFTLNVLSGLRPVTGESDGVLGNLGTTVLVECRDGDGTFADQARALQEQLYAGVAHNDVSGLEVLRRFSTAHRTAASSFVPYVFAPGRGLTGAAEPPEITAPGWRHVDSGIHTPQVLIDHQAYGDGDELVLNWDAVDEAFPDGLLDDAFAFYRGLLDRLLAPGADWARLDPATHRLPSDQLLARWRANHTARPAPEGLLQDGFLATVERAPERLAVLDGDVVLRYADVHAYAAEIADRLRAAGVGRGDLVAVRAARRWQQAVAVLGVLQAGGAYLPLDPDWPAERVAWLLEQSGARALVSAASAKVAGGPPVPVLDIGPRPGAARAVEPRAGGAPDDLAYVIYTSGSTGRPKGVAISHRAALNTVRDITDRFGVTGDDRTLCLSALSFDLSVFDLFGLLGAGGAVVGVAPGPPDPAGWARLVHEHRVTVWNSVPAILELALDQLGTEQHQSPADLLATVRLVLLSGDWIPVSLPERLRAVAADARLVALGGATEASIWSNSYPVGELDPGWPSVPYGHPLTNQRMHVLDRRLADAPSWVPGDLYIAGTGLALGYHNEPDRTAASFPRRPDGDERLYRTGDLARYRPDGCLEFLGRADDQVKIDGYRIELGEVESTLLRCPGVRAAAAVVVGEPGGSRRLAAFVVPAAGVTPDHGAIRSALADWLPAYMVPRELVALDRLPLTANGKLDRARLVATARDAEPVDEQIVAPRTDVERTLAELWAEVLGRTEVSVTHDFFALGGSSRSAVQLMNRVRERLDPSLGLRHLFEHPTLEAQAALVGRQGEGAGVAELPLPRLRPGSGAGHLVLVHPIGGGVLCYRELVAALPAALTVLGAQHAGLDGGPTPGSVPELAGRYVRQLELAAPGGAVVLAGWSMGGVIALEMARRLGERGTVGVDRVLVLDGWATADPTAPPADAAAVVRDFLLDLANGADPGPEVGSALGPGADGRTVLRHGLRRLRSAGLVDPDLRDDEVERLFRVYRANYDALRGYPLPVPTSRVDLFVARRAAPPRAGLVPLHDVLDRSAAPVATIDLDADHFTIVARPAVARIAEHLGRVTGAGSGRWEG